MRRAVALYPLLRPLAFALDAERAHRLTIRALKVLPAGRPAAPDPMLAIERRRDRLPQSGRPRRRLRQGCRGARAMLGFGFGFVEVGTLTPLPQARQSQAAPVPAGRGRGGDQPHGLQQSRPGGSGRAAGAGPAAARSAVPGIVGVNIGANKDSAARRRRRDRRLCAGRARDGAGRRLSHRQHLLAQHAGPARAAGQGRARRTARRGDGGAGGGRRRSS